MRKIFFITIPLLFLLGIGVYFLFLGGKYNWDIKHTLTPETPVLTYEQERAKTEKINRENTEFYNAAMRNQDAAFCDGIIGIEKKNECHDMIKATQAKKDKTIEVCDTLSSTGVIMLCRDAISSDRAIATQDRIICNHISDTDRKTYCKEAVDETILRGHIESHTVTKELCTSLSDRYETECMAEIQELNESAIYNNALSNNDAKLCTQISQLELRTTCQDTINLKGAVSTASTDLCENITDTQKKLYCQSQVTKSNDMALYKSAISGTDIDSCTKIINTNLQNKCHDTIIITRVKNEQNSSLCKDLRNTGIINSCQQIVQ